MFWSLTFKGVYPLSACTACLFRCSSVDLKLFLLFLSCVLHNLWIYTKPRSPSFQGRYNLNFDDLGWQQLYFVGSRLVSLLRPSRSVSVHLIIPNE
jgi:hypothetical protein